MTEPTGGPSLPDLHPRRRFVSRRLMLVGGVIAVVAGTLLAAGWAFSTSVTYQRRADRHARKAAYHEASRTAGLTAWSDREARLADHHARMNRKWEDAAYQPWLPVEPDPPEPE